MVYYTPLHIDQVAMHERNGNYHDYSKYVRIEQRVTIVTIADTKDSACIIYLLHLPTNVTLSMSTSLS